MTWRTNEILQDTESTSILKRKEITCYEVATSSIIRHWTVVLEKTLESPLDCKEIQPVLSKGDQPWVFFGRNDAEAETPVLWPPHAKSWLIGKDSDAGRDWGQEEKGMKEDEMAGWHHWLDGRESEWTLGVGDGQGGLACCYSCGSKKSDTTQWLNWTELSYVYHSACAQHTRIPGICEYMRAYQNWLCLSNIPDLSVKFLASLLVFCRAFGVQQFKFSEMLSIQLICY